jgi:L-seryl-tRNA(Ser) seleniumtransferase
VGARQPADELTERLRELPSVERLAAALAQREAVAGTSPPDRLMIAAARETVERRRDELRAGLALPEDPVDLLERAQRALVAARRPSLRRVINATGVVVHTNLGRAPLAAAARDAVARIAAGYSNLELDLETGERGSRQEHVGGLACALSGAEAALVVNNGAGAVLLAAAALAGTGRSLIVSRGQLIEIGGSFRIPDVVAASGARMVEVGTTNRTRLADYERGLAHERALGRPVGAVLRVHPSNFRTLGFVEEVDIEALCDLGLPVIDDVGSGALGDRWPSQAGLDALADEPAVRRSVAAGAALVCFSGDKLLGGPQAGLLVGRDDAVARASRHPLARALRVDKLSLAALEATLALYRDPDRARREIPVLAMLDVPMPVLAERARRLVAGLAGAGLGAQVVTASARVGGGALPLMELSGPVARLDPGPRGADAAAAALRLASPAVVARISEGAVLMDPRTMTDSEVDEAAATAVDALGAAAPSRG